MLTDPPVIPPPPHFEIFWEAHRQKVILGITVAVLCLALVGGVLLWSHAQRNAATALLANAKDKAGWQSVADRYPRSGAAANALLLLAGAQRDEHNIEASNATYTRFLKQFPHYPLAISAFLGRAVNEDSAGHPDQAINELQQAASAYPQSYGAPIALLQKARILARLGKINDSKHVLQIISNQYPDSLVTTVVLRQEMPRLK